MDRLLDRTYGERPRASKIAQVPRSDLLVDLREHRNNCTRALGFHLKFLNSLRRTDRRRVEGSRPLAQLGMRASERLTWPACRYPTEAQCSQRMVLVGTRVVQLK